jgi:hypothetical protein
VVAGETPRINLCQRKSPTKPKKRLTTNALIAEMRFFGIPTESLPTVSARKSGLIVARTTFGLVATRETIR